jgi:hypothetical protein
VIYLDTSAYFVQYNAELSTVGGCVTYLNVIFMELLWGILSPPHPLLLKLEISFHTMALCVFSFHLWNVGKSWWDNSEVVFLLISKSDPYFWQFICSLRLQVYDTNTSSHCTDWFCYENNFSMLGCFRMLHRAATFMHPCCNVIVLDVIFIIYFHLELFSVFALQIKHAYFWMILHTKNMI